MLEDLKICGIDPQSYLLLKEGIKPVIRLGINKSVLEAVKRSASNLGLHLLIKEFKELYGEKLKEPIINAYYSLNKKSCEEAFLAEKDGNRNKLGEILGYPECCVNMFVENLGKEKTLMSLENVKSKPSFYCNNIFVFDSKLGRNDIEIFLNNREIFNNDDVRNLFLIRHVPCSYDCKESIRIGKVTLKLLKNNFPDLAKKIITALKNPVLYWNYFKWIIVNGRIKRDLLEYKEVLDYKSLVEDEIKNMVERGNNMKIMNGKIVILKNNEKIGELPREDDIPVCINFQ